MIVINKISNLFKVFTIIIFIVISLFQPTIAQDIDSVENDFSKAEDAEE